MLTVMCLPARACLRVLAGGGAAGLYGERRTASARTTRTAHRIGIAHGIGMHPPTDEMLITDGP